jgi:hypothetical protein
MYTPDLLFNYFRRILRLCNARQRESLIRHLHTVASTLEELPNLWIQSLDGENIVHINTQIFSAKKAMLHVFCNDIEIWKPFTSLKWFAADFLFSWLRSLRSPWSQVNTISFEAGGWKIGRTPSRWECLAVLARNQEHIRFGGPLLIKHFAYTRHEI